jgi:hypothetical protein
MAVPAGEITSLYVSFLAFRYEKRKQAEVVLFGQLHLPLSVLLVFRSCFCHIVALPEKVYNSPIRL